MPYPYPYPYPALRYLLASLVLAASPVQAANYLKLAGNHVDFYYDSDFWNLGATVNGDGISVRTDSMAQLAEVTQGAAAPYLGQVYTAEVSVARASYLSLIAVAHTGFALNNDIGATASLTLRSTGFSGTTTYGLGNAYTSGTIVNGAFAASGALGHSGAYYFSQYDGWGNDSSNGYEVPLELTTLRTHHEAIAAGSNFYGYASVTGLGIAEVALNGISYSFNVTAVPEPHAYLLLGAGLALLGYTTRRRRRGVP